MSRMIELAERAVIALERIAGALAGEQPITVLDETLASDVRAGLSLRECARKHGVGVGRVRGAVARAACETRRATQGEKQ